MFRHFPTSTLQSSSRRTFQPKNYVSLIFGLYKIFHFVFKKKVCAAAATLFCGLSSLFPRSENYHRTHFFLAFSNFHKLAKPYQTGKWDTSGVTLHDLETSFLKTFLDFWGLPCVPYSAFEIFIAVLALLLPKKSGAQERGSHERRSDSLWLGTRDLGVETMATIIAIFLNLNGVIMTW